MDADTNTAIGTLTAELNSRLQEREKQYQELLASVTEDRTRRAVAEANEKSTRNELERTQGLLAKEKEDRRTEKENLEGQLKIEKTEKETIQGEKDELQKSYDELAQRYKDLEEKIKKKDKRRKKANRGFESDLELACKFLMTGMKRRREQIEAGTDSESGEDDTDGGNEEV